MKRKITGRPGVAALVFGFLWLLPLGAAAQVEKAEVRIDGMT